MPRTALVTGASTGIGRATALELARRGWTVLAGMRQPADIGAGITPLRLDVTSPEDVAALRGRPLDALVNNAGIAVTGPLEYLPPAELREQLEVNTVGQLAVTQACLPALRATRGRIVNVSSVSGRVALPTYGPYAASKFALEALSDSLRRELRGSGVDVVVVEPGGVATPIWDRGLGRAEALWQAMPAEAHAHYGRLYTVMRAQAEKLAREGDPAKALAAMIAGLLEARRPRARYVFGRAARIEAALAHVLPAQVLDALLAAVVRRGT